MRLGAGADGRRGGRGPRNERCGRTGWTGEVLAVGLALLVCAAWSAARNAEQEPLPPGGVQMRGGGMVWITVEGDLLVLGEEIPLPPENGIPVPPGLQGSLAFGVASPLPDWEVRAQFEWAAGAGGPMEASRVMVRSAATGEEFVSIADGPVVAQGHGPMPVTDLWLELQVRPGWTAPPGQYEGLLHLVPVGSVGNVEDEIEAPGGGDQRGLPGAGPPSALGGMPDGGGAPERALAGRVTVPVQLTNGSLTVVMVGELDYSIQTAAPGRYYVEPDLDVLVATNEERWDLLLEGTDFVSGENEIPLERVEWSMLDGSGQPGTWTPLGDSNRLMSGYNARGVFPASFRLALEVTLTDVAGDYVSEIHLVGSPG